MPEKLRNKVECDEARSEPEENTITVSGLSVEKLNLGPRKKLLILGLGGLLCHRVYRYEKANVPRFRRADAAYGCFKVYKRPYCEDFVKFCLERFEVGIWASSKEWNFDNALGCVMKGLRSKLVFSWDQAECTYSGLQSLEKKDKPIFLKELKKVWENKGSRSKLPFWIEQYSASNTLMITQQEKALLNPPHTTISLPAYKVDQLDDDGLGPNGELRLYLDGLADADDVPSYVKEHPFGQPAITPEHADWDFYSQIIRHFQKD